jgi:YD repeat-containing protein
MNTVCRSLVWLAAASFMLGVSSLAHADVYWLDANFDPAPHYATLQEACIVGTVGAEIKADRAAAGDNGDYRYVSLTAGPDNGDGTGNCTAVIEKRFFASGTWLPVDSSIDMKLVSMSGSPDACNIPGAMAPNTAQCGSSKCPSCNQAGGNGSNPIETSSGNKFQRETDFVGGGTFPLRFERYYNSIRTITKDPIPLGVGWTHTYDARVVVLTDDNDGRTLDQAKVYRPDGSVQLFKLVGSVWTPDPDVHETLSVSFGTDSQTGGGVTILGATYTRTDDTVESYDQLGRLVSIVNRDGFRQTLSYSTASQIAKDQVQSVVDSNGRMLVFGYAGDQLTSVTPQGGAGQTISFGYTGNNLTSVIYPNTTGTKTRTYTYDEAGQTSGVDQPNALTGITDENASRFASFGYTANKQANLSVHGAFSGPIDRYAFSFNPDGTTTIIDPLIQSRTFSFNVQFGVPRLSALSTLCVYCANTTAARGYDPSGNVNSSTDFNGVVNGYSTDARGLETQRIEAASTPTIPNPTQKRTINTQWNNAAFHVPTQRTVVNSAGTTESLTNWIYNGRGQPTFRCEVDPAAGTTATNYICGSLPSAPVGVRQWAWTYCDAVSSLCPFIGLKLTSADPLSHVTTYAYYPSTVLTGCATVGGVCNYKGDLQYVKNAANQTITFSSYDQNGRPTRITDANGVPTDMTYHPRGWITQKTTRGATSATDQITKYTYDGVGQVTRITQPDASYLIYYYDIAHRLYYIVDNLNNSILYTLDNAGNRKEEDSRTTIGTTTTIYRKVKRVYNTLDQLQATDNAASTPTNPIVRDSYTYDPNGNELLTTDGLTPDGRKHVTANTYDPLNRVSKVWQDMCTASSGCTGAVNATINYSYDARDHLTQVIDPQNLPTTYQFDALNNQTRLSSPDTGAATSKYDAAGNLHTRTDARGVVATYSYDVLNRLTGITYSPVTTPSVNVLFGYDIPETGCPSGATFANGHLTHFQDVSSGTSTTKLCYDRFGNMVYKSQVTSGVTFATSYAYDSAHHLTQITTPQGTLITYTRDLTGRITMVTSTLPGKAATTVVSGVTYYPFGPVASITYGNGHVLTRTYDQDYVISAVADPGTGGLNLVFKPDVVGNLTQMTVGSGSGAPGNIFAYDGLNRLTTVTNSLNSALIAAYTYDATGNRTGKQGSTGSAVPYTYAANTHHLLAIGTTSPIQRSYDNDGNTTGIGTAIPSTEQIFGYNNTGRLTQFSIGSAAKMQYLINALGQRVEKLPTGNAAGNQYTVYNQSGQVLGDYNYTSALVSVRELIWMNDLPVGVLNGATGTKAYIEPDHLGTPRVAVDATSNAAVWNWSPLNDPFGETQPQPGASPSS